MGTVVLTVIQVGPGPSLGQMSRICLPPMSHRCPAGGGGSPGWRVWVFGPRGSRGPAGVRGRLRELDDDILRNATRSDTRWGCPQRPLVPTDVSEFSHHKALRKLSNLHKSAFLSPKSGRLFRESARTPSRPGKTGPRRARPGHRFGDRGVRHRPGEHLRLQCFHDPPTFYPER